MIEEIEEENEKTQYVDEYCCLCYKETTHLKTKSGKLLCLNCSTFNIPRNKNKKDAEVKL